MCLNRVTSFLENNDFLQKIFCRYYTLKNKETKSHAFYHILVFYSITLEDKKSIKTRTLYQCTKKFFFYVKRSKNVYKKSLNTFLIDLRIRDNREITFITYIQFHYQFIFYKMKNYLKYFNIQTRWNKNKSLTQLFSHYPQPLIHQIIDINYESGNSIHTIQITKDVR